MEDTKRASGGQFSVDYPKCLPLCVDGTYIPTRFASDPSLKAQMFSHKQGTNAVTYFVATTLSGFIAYCSSLQLGATQDQSHFYLDKLPQVLHQQTTGIAFDGVELDTLLPSLGTRPIEILKFRKAGK